MYALLAICLIQLFHIRIYVDAYISSTANNVTNHFPHFNPDHQNISRKSVLENRRGRFLFDAFFGIDTPPLDADDFEDDDDEEEDAPKPCNCGKY